MVFRARELLSYRPVVVVKKTKVCQEEGIREVGMLKLLNQEGEHVVRLKDHFFDDEGDLLMVFEKHECDLSKFIDKRRPRVHNGPKSLKPDLIKHLMKELLTGVKQLHSQFVVHRDLNLQNILVSTTKRDDDKPVVCIAGLGQAMTMPISTHTHEVMMLCYRPPEILLGGHYTCQVDMWSVGCIFAQLFLGNSQKPLFDADCEFYQLINIFKMLGLPNEDIWPGVTKLPYWHDFCRHDFFLHEYPRLKPGKLNTTMGELVNGDNDALDLLVKMLHCDPSQRIHVFDALEHPYFSTERISERISRLKI